MNEIKKLELEEKSKKHVNKIFVKKEMIDGKKTDVIYIFNEASFISQKEGDGNAVYKGFAKLTDVNGKICTYNLQEVINYFESGE